MSLFFRGECPFGHFPIARVGEINAANRRKLIDGFGDRCHLQPGTVFVQCCEKTPEPAIAIDVIFGTRPDAEFFPIIAKNEDGVLIAICDLSAEVDGLLRVGIRDEIPQLLGPGEDFEQTTTLFGQVIALQFVLIQTCIAKVGVVEHGVLDPCFGNIPGERLFPDSFRNPHAANLGFEQFFEVLFVKLNLTNPIPTWNRGENRFVVGSPEQLDLTPSDKFAHPLDVLGMVLTQPIQQAAREMQDHGEVGEVLQDIEEGDVAILKSSFKNAVKVPDGLVIVQRQNQSYCATHA